MDQGLFAGSNFLLNILLARWLSPSHYGAFVVAYITFWLLAIFHFSFITDPMLVFGVGRYKDNLRTYFRFLHSSHWSFCGILSLCLGVTGYILQEVNQDVLGQAFWVLGIAGPFILLHWLMRRLCYLRLIPRMAALGGVLYVLCIAGGVTLLVQFERLSINSIICLMGMASLTSSVWIFFRLQIYQFPNSTDSSGQDSVEQHWHYGKWTSGASVMAAIPDDLVSVLLPLWGGLEASGAFRSLINLFQLPMQTLGALLAVFIPSFVKAQEKQGYRALIFRLLSILLISTIAYWIVLGTFGELIIGWLYDGKFTEYAVLLWALGLVPVFHSLIIILMAVFAAVEKPRLIFLARMCSTVVVLSLGVGLMAMWGVWGAGIGMASGYATSALALAIMAYHNRHLFSEVGRQSKEVHLEGRV